MQAELLRSMNCPATRHVLSQIVPVMMVPLLQGSLRYAFNVGLGGKDTLKYRAEMATFNAAMIPLVHSCSPEDAAVIYANTKIGPQDVDAVAVIAAYGRCDGASDDGGACGTLPHNRVSSVLAPPAPTPPCSS